MDIERHKDLALQLHRLGVSNKAVLGIMSIHPHERIERQLKYLPFRKARRPEALIVEAIKHDYSPPKEYFYATRKASRIQPGQPMDQDTKSSPRFSDAEAEGHGTPSPAGSAPSNDGMEPGRSASDSLLQDLDIPNWTAE